MKGITIFITILVLTLATRNMHFQTGNIFPRLVNERGYLPINCYGGSGSYNYYFTNLPQGWSYQGNNIIIPNIANLQGSYSFRARVTDTAGNVLNGIINLRINGLSVIIQSGNGINDNEIIYSINGNNGFLGTGSGVGVTPGSGSGNPTAPSASDLYSSYPGLPAGTNVVPASGSFPTNSPSGIPSTPNPTPNIIRNIQATYSVPRDSQPISVNDIQRNSVFNRQLNANKAVANLISIIQQLTANVNAARNDIQLLEQALQDAQLAYNDCNQDVFTLADTRARIQNAIADRQNRVNDINNRINQILPQIGSLTQVLDSLIRQRTQAEQDASPNAERLADLEDELAKCEAQKRRYEVELSDLQNQINQLRIQIQTTRDNAAAAPGEIRRIQLQIPIVDRKILDLQQQIIQAQNERKDLLDEKDRYRRIISQANTLISKFQGEITILESQIPRIQNNIDRQTAICDEILEKLNELRSLIGQNEANFQILLEQIRTQQSLIDDKEAQINSLRSQIEGLPNQITLLQNQLSRVQTSLRRQFFICNNAADEVRKAKQNLDAMNTKIQTESRWLQQANANLERARAEKAIADVSVQEIIATSTNALPFTIIPNGNGQTNVGTPAGNNPAGSALGPVRIRNQVDPNRQIIIGDISSYLSRAYRAGVDPSRPSTVSSVYPLSIATLQTLVAQGSTGIVNLDTNYQYPSGGIYNFGCSSNNNMVYGSGAVYSVQPGMIQVRDERGSLINLRVSGCSNLEATQQGHTLGLNDQVYYRAVEANNGMNLHSLTCLA